jgi:lactate dehydrogenase-like 2-hydroxyacid dehydrogenase
MLLRKVPSRQPDRHAGEWPKRNAALGTTMAGKRAGILGLGRIGKAIAERLAASGNEDRLSRPQPQKDVGITYYPTLPRPGEELRRARRCQPGGAETKNMVNAEILAALGPNGKVINIARGSVIDEPALIACAEVGKLGGAGARRVRQRAERPGRAAGDGQRGAVPARRQRDEGNAQGDGRPGAGEPRRVFRRQAAGETDPELQ